MSRYIDADKFISYIDCGHLRNPTELCFSEIDVVNMINKQPTANVKPVVRGEWIDLDLCVKCSYCGHFEHNLYFFCPNCGAKMDEKEG